MDANSIFSAVSSRPGPEGGGGGGGGGKKKGRDSTSRLPAPWPPPWATPPWPVWNDAEINKEPWDVGKMPKPPDPFALMGMDESSREKSPKDKKTVTEKQSERSQKGKGKQQSHSVEEIFIPFEDPLGPGALPPSLSARAVQWVRGADVPNVALLSAEEDAKYGRDAREPPDLAACNPYALYISPLLRFIVSSIRALYFLGRDAPIPLEPNDDYAPEVKTPWRPWHHIYALCEATNAHPATPQFNAAGKYVVRLHVLGTWRRVTVDDRIPEDRHGRPLLPVLLPTRAPSPEPSPPSSAPRSSKPDKRRSGAAVIPPGVELRIWPAILCKALLRVASLSWRAGVDAAECGELAGFSPISCLTGWVVQRLDVRGIEPTVTWALVHKLMNANSTDAEQQFTGYVTPEDELEAKRKAEEMLIPSKYNFPKKPPPPPSPLELPLKDEGLWEPKDFTEMEAEILDPAAVMAVLREDLRSTPAALRALSRPSSSFDWSWLEGSGGTRPSEEATEESSGEGEREGELEVEWEGEETTTSTGYEEESLFADQWNLKAQEKLPESHSLDFKEHKALAPRWEQPVLLTEANILSESVDAERPPTPLWQRHRWKAWAIASGLIPPERVRIERRVRVFTPLCGVIQIPPPPVPPGPLHPPVPPLPLPLGYPFKEFPPGLNESGEKVKEKENAGATEEKADAKSTKKSEDMQKEPKGKKGSTEEKHEEKPKKEEKTSEKDQMEPWVRFDILQPEIVTLEVYYRPSTFAFQVRITSLAPANVQTQGVTMGADAPPTGPKKGAAKGKDTAKPIPEVYSPKLPMPPSEFGTEPLYFLMDTMSCKKLLIQLCIIADDVLRNLQIILDANDPEKWLQQEVHNILGPRSPYDNNPRIKNACGGHLVGENYRWSQNVLGSTAFSLKTNGAQSLLVTIGEGMAVLRLWLKVPRYFSLAVMSPTEFTLGRRTPAHAIMNKESVSYLKRGEELAATYNQLMGLVAKAPAVRRPPSPADGDYKAACMNGKEKGAHGKAFRDFFKAILPPALPHLPPEKLDRIWIKLLHRLEVGLISMLMEKHLPAEDCLRCIQQWQQALQEPYFGLITLANYEETGGPTVKHDEASEEESAKEEEEAALGEGEGEGEEGGMRELAADVRQLLGFASPDAARVHPGKDECDVDNASRPPSGGTAITEESKGSGEKPKTPKGKDKKPKEKEKEKEKEKDSGLGEIVVEMDDETAIDLLKRMLLPVPPLLHMYPFRQDHLHRMFSTEYRGVAKAITREWFVVVRCLVNPHQDHPVLCAVFCSVYGYQFPWVMVIDNETLRPVAASSRFGCVEPFYAQHSESGYTVLVVIEVPKQTKELPWLLRFAAKRPEDLVHHCRPPPDPAKGTRSELGSQHSMDSQADNKGQPDSRSSSAPGKTGPSSATTPPPLTPLTPPCPGPQQPPTLLDLQLRGLYTAPSDGIVACGILRMPVSMPWVPTVMLSIHVRLSSPQAKFRLTMEDVETGETLIDTTSVGHKTIPVYFVEVPPPPTDVEAPKGRVTTTGISEAMLRATAAGLRVGSPRRGPSALVPRASAVGVVVIMRITVLVKPGDWPLTPLELQNVERAKGKDRKQAMLYGEEAEEGGEKVRSFAAPGRQPSVLSLVSSQSEISSATGATATGKKGRRLSTSKSVVSQGTSRKPGPGLGEEDPESPCYLLVVVVDQEKTGRSELTSDIPRAISLRMLKEQWEMENPGRHVLAEEARRQFLQRREEGQRIMMAAAQLADILDEVTGVPEDQEDRDIDDVERLIGVPTTYGDAWPDKERAASPFARPSFAPPPPPPTASAPRTAEELPGEDQDQELPLALPIVRTRSDMLDEMTQNAYDRGLLDTPLRPVHITPMQVQLNSYKADKEMEKDMIECREIFDSLDDLRHLQQRVGMHSAAALARSEAHAREAHTAAKTMREKAMADAKKEKKDAKKAKNEEDANGDESKSAGSARKTRKSTKK